MGPSSARTSSIHSVGGIATLKNLVNGAGAITPGFGIRYYSPVGPIRVDLGINPSLAEDLAVVTEAAGQRTEHARAARHPAAIFAERRRGVGDRQDPESIDAAPLDRPGVLMIHRLSRLLIVLLAIATLALVGGVGDDEHGLRPDASAELRARHTARASTHGVVRIGAMTGNLLVGATIHGVSITDSAGRPFLKADSVKGRYQVMSFLAKRVLINNLRLYRPEIVVEKLPNAKDWNYRVLWPASKPNAADTVPGFGSWIRFENANVFDGHITVRSPWSPRTGLTARVRDSLVKDALAGGSRLAIVRAPGGYQKIIELQRTTGRFPVVRISDPAYKSTRLIDVAALRTLALPFRPPAADIRAVEGRFEFNDDSVWWKQRARGHAGIADARRRHLSHQQRRHEAHRRGSARRVQRLPVGVPAHAEVGGRHGGNRGHLAGSDAGLRHPRCGRADGGSAPAGRHRRHGDGHDRLPRCEPAVHRTHHEAHQGSRTGREAAARGSTGGQREVQRDVQANGRGRRHHLRRVQSRHEPSDRRRHGGRRGQARRSERARSPRARQRRCRSTS